MPFVRRTTIAAVRNALAGGARLAAPYFRARRGHPVALAGVFYKDLLMLEGDAGARRLVSDHEIDLVKIPVGDPGVIRDIDTPVILRLRLESEDGQRAPRRAVRRRLRQHLHL